MEFLNKIILGDQVLRERDFDFVDKVRISNPAYDPRFFESFSTLWASAYAFQKAIEPPAGRDNKAVGEWVSLFLLHFYQVLHLEAFDKNKIESEYSLDLWSAISGTYLESNISRVVLLKTSEDMVVGAYVPNVVFFPCRGRSSWCDNDTLRLYLEGSRLSWEKCKDVLLPQSEGIGKFLSHLRSIATYVLEGDLRIALNEFCDNEPIFRGVTPVEIKRIDRDPLNWIINPLPESGELLDKYPLKRKNENGKWVYYLVGTMRHTSEWMRKLIEPGMPSPNLYKKEGDKQIDAKFSGRTINCYLAEGDEIVLLDELFLSDPTWVCGIPKGSSPYASSVRNLHKLEVRDSEGIFSSLQGQTAVCPVPINLKFLEHFPEILRDPEGNIRARRNADKDEVEWTFKILGKEVTWETKLAHVTELRNSMLTIWPPKVADKWHFYVARGTGDKKTCGRWSLVDENGKEGTNIELSEREYFNILTTDTNKPNVPNRPKALLLKDEIEKEKGLLFLSGLESRIFHESRKASLAVDFGTSNTSIAYKVKDPDKDSTPQSLVFELSPVTLWGELSPFVLESAGFIPSHWGGEKGFYPTVLLVRRDAIARLAATVPGNIKVEDLFQASIPGLHKKLVDPLFEGRLRSYWEAKDNLKWNLTEQTPFRLLFLWLSLLYAHAEIFFRHNAEIDDYVFTFPLALPCNARKYFHQEAEEAIRKTRKYCYGAEASRDIFNYIDNVDESTAIAKSVQASGQSTVLEVFVDMGGSTADIAIRNAKQYLVLDSIKVAGRTFIKTAEENYSEADISGAQRFKDHLKRLLQINDLDQLLPFDRSGKGREITGLPSFDSLYSLALNSLPVSDFDRGEAHILEQTMGSLSYQKYRTQLLFRHVIAYALLQACAAVVAGKLKPTDGITMIFGGNAWALMMFAEFPRIRETLRKESEEVLTLLKKHLLDYVEEDEKQYIESLKVFDVHLLNERNLSDAKTSVAKGSLVNLNVGATGMEEKAKPYSGITIKNLQVNGLGPITVRWCDRWSFEEIRRKLEEHAGISEIRSLRFENSETYTVPIDPLLSIFTRLGNVQHHGEDQMTPQEWSRINGLLLNDRLYLDNAKPKNAPISCFVSEVLYSGDQKYLKILAYINETLKRRP